MTNNGRPNFFLVGAPKAGTTSLYRYLGQHPDIYMSPIKEPHYFADEIRFENFDEHMQKMSAARDLAFRRYLKGPASERFSGGPVDDWGCYLKLFGGATSQTALGEASTCYLWSPTAAANIASAFPDAKIVMVLRDPAERALSQYRHMLSFAPKTISFSQYLDAGMSVRSTEISETYPFLQFGLYSTHILRYLKHFPQNKVHIAFYDDYLRDAPGFVAEVYRFLGVDSSFRADVSERHMAAAIPRSHGLNRGLKRAGIWNLARRASPLPLRRRLRRLAYRPNSSVSMSAAERARLVAFYRDDINCLSQLVKRDLHAWLYGGPSGSSLR
jgi:hypothetical protein